MRRGRCVDLRLIYTNSKRGLRGQFRMGQECAKCLWHKQKARRFEPPGYMCAVQVLLTSRAWSPCDRPMQALLQDAHFRLSTMQLSTAEPAHAPNIIARLMA